MVDFSALARPEGQRPLRVVACGERGADLAVRLEYANIHCELAELPMDALALLEAGKVEMLLNYTALRDFKTVLDAREKNEVSSESVLRIGVLMPEVLGTYGDTGNAMVLAERARRRGILAEIRSPSPSGSPKASTSTPSAAARTPPTLSPPRNSAKTRALSARSTRAARSSRSRSPVLGHCTGMRGTWRADGLGALDITTDPQGSRSIGEPIPEPLLEGLSAPLTGFENHGGEPAPGPHCPAARARPLRRRQRLPGVSEPGPAAYDGAVQGSIIATYMRPGLACNLELADLLLTRATGPDLAALPVPGVDELRAERLAESRA